MSTFLLADERPLAAPEFVLEYKIFCTEVAEDDGTGKLNLDEYLLICVNEELESEGYQPVTKLPK
jgi:hypothetical protein